MKIVSRNFWMDLDRPRIMGILNVTPDSFSDGGEFVKIVSDCADGGGFSRKKSKVEKANVSKMDVSMANVKKNEIKDMDFLKADVSKVDVVKAARRFFEMAEEGADIIDIGGESTGPGSKDVSLEEELRRVIPVLKQVCRVIKAPSLFLSEFRRDALKNNPAVLEKFSSRDMFPWISVDTYKAEVARRAIALGVHIINDVTALRGDPAMAKVIAESGVAVVLMYSKDLTPRTTSDVMPYDDVVLHIKDFLKERVDFALSQGIRREQIILDPGMGAFVSGDPRYSIEILKRLDEFHELGFPILVGASRKGFIGEILGGLPANERLSGSLACVAQALRKGAHILRAHDVAETKQFLRVFESFL